MSEGLNLETLSFVPTGFSRPALVKGGSVASVCDLTSWETSSVGNLGVASHAAIK